MYPPRLPSIWHGMALGRAQDRLIRAAVCLSALMLSPPASIAVRLECGVGRHTGTGVCVPHIGLSSGLLLLSLSFPCFGVLADEVLELAFRRRVTF